MALKQRHKTGKKGDKRHNDGLNTKTDMAYYVKCEMTEFEIQTRDICTPVSYTHLRAHETDSYLVCRLLLEK